MERILIATDGSDSAREALHVGVELASEQGTPVTIVHVVGEENGGSVNDSRPEQDSVLCEAVEIAWRAEVEPDLELATGEVAEEVARVAERIDADLVIVGSRGLGKVGATLLGSVSRAVLDRCAQPVMVVHGHRLPS